MNKGFPDRARGTYNEIPGCKPNGTFKGQPAYIEKLDEPMEDFAYCVYVPKTYGSVTCFAHEGEVKINPVIPMTFEDTFV
jgi:hypothetical protein